jgi:hypothetical protein
MSALGQKQTSALKSRCPLYPQKRTFAHTIVKHKRTGRVRLIRLASAALQNSPRSAALIELPTPSVSLAALPIPICRSVSCSGQHRA